MRDAIARHAPDVVVTLAGSDGHRDHARDRDAVIDCWSARTPRPPERRRRPLQAWVRQHAGDDGKSAYRRAPEIGTPDEDLTTILELGLPRMSRAAIALHARSTAIDGIPD